ncbi:hypothetical protein PHYBLDRAFT_61022 [Phycomyces blakesleeanus NRRL 1555(-)]|uniref:Uncharacterized protein n=1 Tax=Phycomyces blakesleeanus (strain ATCC 8743b / DSM 1359 / FGSC 10004 / NBRC 33097 / NRRL 1555) TaxID=763407 RepID=A0A167N475_PHYB8|nr:hypothetical protein PHYBLDRAFT_61022 [Phycomyces blakesleeanus NRRL 1555(-)]OAD74934.1 hypothetical protein PHYBLDRAFT_61022 [Phycomyces blakesleeanus NRRL 1555(-)]|eukprot:XP_018292974.1 hypothetical protein PHYBLDRAFT_61022 [Phycomyces blakesleeanus NRRL 1555(-)]
MRSRGGACVQGDLIVGSGKFFHPNNKRQEGGEFSVTSQGLREEKEPVYSIGFKSGLCTGQLAQADIIPILYREYSHFSELFRNIDAYKVSSNWCHNLVDS